MNSIHNMMKVLDLTEVDPDLRGFTGGFAAGHWGFLVPFKNKETQGEFSGKMVRFDLRTFDHASVTVKPCCGGYTLADCVRPQVRSTNSVRL